MASGTLAEYLVRIGFDVDKHAEDKMTSAVRAGAAQAQILVDAVEAGLRSFSNMVTQVAGGLEDLYYASQRTRSSVAEIQAVERAADRMGSSAEEARSSLENFSRFLKTNPGSSDWIRNLAGVSEEAWKKLSDLGQMQATIEGLSKREPLSLQYQRMGDFGIGENYWRAVANADWQKVLAEQEQFPKRVGLDPEEAAKNNTQFLNNMRDFQTQLNIIWAKVEADFVKGGGAASMKEFSTWLQEHSGEISTAITDILKAILAIAKEMGPWLVQIDKAVTSSVGWKNAIEGVAAAILLMNTRLGTLFALQAPAWALSLLGLGGVAGGVVAGAQLYGSQGELGVDPNSPMGQRLAAAGRKGGNPLGVKDDRNLWQRLMPSWLGGKPAPWEQAAPGNNDDKSSYQKPGDSNDKRAGLSARYEQAMRVAEDELKRQGVPAENARAAAAIMVGNASAESELIPSTMHDGGTGYGIYGARLDRRDAMLNWLAKNGYAKDSLAGQVRYMAIEARRRGGAAWEALQTATSNNLAANGMNFEHFFEAPAIDNNRSGQIIAAWRAHHEAPLFSLGVAPAAASARPLSTNPFGGLFDASGKLIGVPALGTPSPSSMDNSSSITNSPTLNHSTKIEINGVEGGYEALGAMLARVQNNVAANMIRDLQGSVA